MQCKETQTKKQKHRQKKVFTQFAGGWVILVLEFHTNTLHKVHQSLPKNYLNGLNAYDLMTGLIFEPTPPYFVKSYNFYGCTNHTHLAWQYVKQKFHDLFNKRRLKSQNINLFRFIDTVKPRFSNLQNSKNTRFSNHFAADQLSNC